MRERKDGAEEAALQGRRCRTGTVFVESERPDTKAVWFEEQRCMCKGAKRMALVRRCYKDYTTLGLLLLGRCCKHGAVRGNPMWNPTRTVLQNRTEG